jgi:threonine dehydratase
MSPLKELFLHIDDANKCSISNTVKLISEFVIKTPVRRLYWLEKYIGYPVYAKLELQQITGSFKYRGALAKLLSLGNESVYCAASAGNHGLAVSKAAAEIGTKANICVPLSASPLKKQRIVETGGGLIEYGNTVEEATDHAIRLSKNNDWQFISPYNDIDVILGQGTVWYELLEDLPDIKHLISPIGGGGLISGSIIAAHELSREVSIFGCEPQNYASMQTSIGAGAITDVLRRPTFADGLATNLESNSITFNIVQNSVSEIVVLSEEEIATSVLALLNRESLLSEGAGALSVSACLRLAEKGKLKGPVGIVISGGNIHHTTLARILSYPIQNELCMRLLERRGRRKDEIAVHKVYGEKVPKYFGRAIGSLKDDLLYLTRKNEEVLFKTQKALHNYADYCKSEGLAQSETANELVASILQSSHEAILKSKEKLEKTSLSDEEIIQAEIELRACSQAVASSRNCLNWRSPVYGQSMVPQFFNLGAQESGDVNYERYGFSEIRRIEQQMLDIMGLPADKYGCTVVNSGMAAYSMIEGYLIRNRLEPKDNVVVSPYIYFESDEQLKTLKWLNIFQTESYDTDKFIGYIQTLNPKVVFVDPLSNTTEQRMVDVAHLLSKFSDHKSSPAIVIDGSMLPGAMSQAISEFRFPENIFYMESCSKYLQFGLDMSMAGLVIHDINLKSSMERIRRNMGLILSEIGAMLFPAYDKKQLLNRIARMENNGCILAEMLSENEQVSRLMRVIHPSLSTHPDHDISLRLKRYGGCITFKLKTAAEDHKDQLESFIDLLLKEAVSRKVPISKGVSFGFSFTRICSASSMAEGDPPFLRMSVGDHSEIQNSLIVECFAEAAAKIEDVVFQI